MNQPLEKSGQLYLVGTPIGNLEDITFRAIRILQEVDLIAAEDTRHTRILLEHYHIQKPLTSYHMHNEHEKTQHLLKMVKEGKQIAVVTDGGMPGISDPGWLIVREAVQEGIEPTIIPGPCALIYAITASGLPCHEFLFCGFLPSKGEKRRRRLRDHAKRCQTLCYYESPYRLSRFLEDVCEVIGPTTQVVIFREATKIYEQRIRGEAKVLLETYRHQSWKGEITVVLHHHCESTLDEEPYSYSKDQDLSNGH